MNENKKKNLRPLFVKIMYRYISVLLIVNYAYVNDYHHTTPMSTIQPTNKCDQKTNNVFEYNQFQNWEIVIKWKIKILFFSLHQKKKLEKKFSILVLCVYVCVWYDGGGGYIDYWRLFDLYLYFYFNSWQYQIDNIIIVVDYGIPRKTILKFDFDPCFWLLLLLLLLLQW